MTVDAGSDVARRVRNLSVSEDQIEADYPLYTDLLPGQAERERKVLCVSRHAAPPRGVTLRHIAVRCVRATLAYLSSNPRNSWTLA